jgi:uncharacterized membrane protein
MRGTKRKTFSDGAIAMTLLAPDLAKPEASSIRSAADLHAALAPWSAYAPFALSFAVLAVYWIAQYRTFRDLQRVDTTVLLLNLAFLAGFTFLPFPTAIPQRFTDGRFAVMLYAGTLATMGLIWPVLWNHASTAGLLPSVEDRDPQMRDILLTPIIFLASMGIAWCSPSWATRSWILLAFIRRTHAFFVSRRRVIAEKPSS